jgi:hypothetical protein
MKKIILTKQNGGGSYKITVIGDKKKETWGKIDGNTVIDYEAKAIAQDAKHDGYLIIFN